jgi:hypothetical protein
MDPGTMEVALFSTLLNILVLVGIVALLFLAARSIRRMRAAPDEGLLQAAFSPRAIILILIAAVTVVVIVAIATILPGAQSGDVSLERGVSGRMGSS